MSQTMTQTEKVDQMWSEYASKVLKTRCILDNHLTLEHSSNHEFTFARSDSKYFPVPMLKIDEWIRLGQGEERVWAGNETRGEGDHTIHPDRTPGPCEVFARVDHTSLALSFLQEGRAVSLGYTYFSRQLRSTQSHTSQFVQKITHFTCQSTYFMTSQITNMSQSRKFEKSSQIYFLHIFTFL